MRMPEIRRVSVSNICSQPASILIQSCPNNCHRKRDTIHMISKSTQLKLHTTHLTWQLSNRNVIQVSNDMEVTSHQMTTGHFQSKTYAKCKTIQFINSQFPYTRRLPRTECVLCVWIALLTTWNTWASMKPNINMSCRQHALHIFFKT